MARPFKLIFLTILGVSLVVISQIALARIAQAGIKPASQTGAKVARPALPQGFQDPVC